jgi:hypothetical protein
MSCAQRSESFFAVKNPAYLMPRITIMEKSEIDSKQTTPAANSHPGLEDAFTRELWEIATMFLDINRKSLSLAENYTEL